MIPSGLFPRIGHSQWMILLIIPSGLFPVEMIFSSGKEMMQGGNYDQGLYETTGSVPEAFANQGRRGFCPRNF